MAPLSPGISAATGVFFALPDPPGQPVQGLVLTLPVRHLPVPMPCQPLLRVGALRGNTTDQEAWCWSLEETPLADPCPRRQRALEALLGQAAVLDVCDRLMELMPHDFWSYLCDKVAHPDLRLVLTRSGAVLLGLEGPLPLMAGIGAAAFAGKDAASCLRAALCTAMFQTPCSAHQALSRPSRLKAEIRMFHALQTRGPIEMLDLAPLEFRTCRHRPAP